MLSKTSVTIYSNDHEKLGKLAAALQIKEPLFTGWTVADIISEMVDTYLDEIMKNHGISEENIAEVEEW